MFGHFTYCQLWFCFSLTVMTGPVRNVPESWLWSPSVLPSGVPGRSCCPWGSVVGHGVILLGPQSPDGPVWFDRTGRCPSVSSASDLRCPGHRSLCRASCCSSQSAQSYRLTSHGRRWFRSSLSGSLPGLWVLLIRLLPFLNPSSHSLLPQPILSVICSPVYPLVYLENPS